MLKPGFHMAINKHEEQMGCTFTHAVRPYFLLLLPFFPLLLLVSLCWQNLIRKRLMVDVDTSSQPPFVSWLSA